MPVARHPFRESCKNSSPRLRVDTNNPAEMRYEIVLGIAAKSACGDIKPANCCIISAISDVCQTRTEDWDRNVSQARAGLGRSTTAHWSRLCKPLVSIDFLAPPYEPLRG